MTTGTFFYPGPTEVRSEILRAMTQPMIPHRGQAFRDLMARMQPGLRELFGTELPVFVSTSTATGLMEAAKRGLRTGPVLCVVNGAFSERFAAIALACGRSVQRYDVEWGLVPDPSRVNELLAAGRDGEPFAGLALVHSETSTGAMTDVAGISEIARTHGVHMLVDSVTGVAGVAFNTDAWGLDFALTGSQKALALPPGLALGVASGRYMATAGQAPNRGLYLDVVELAKYAEKGETPNTPVIPLLFALDAQLAAIRSEGLAARFARHARMAEMTYAWVDGWNARTYGAIHLLPPAGARSPSVSVITLPKGVSATDLVAAVRDRGFVIGTGYGKIRETTFRIGHMGDHTPANLERCLGACDAALTHCLASH